MDNINKTSLEEAKVNFEQIKKFATEAAKKEFESEINDKVDKILKESLSIEVDDEGNATVVKDDKVVELTNDGEVEVENKSTHDEEDNESHFDVEDDEEIEIEKNIDEMITFEQEEQAPEAIPVDASAAPAPEEIPTEAPVEAPVEETPAVDSDVLELAQLIDKIIEKKVGGETETEQGVDVDYIDDETAEAPVEPVAAPAPAPATAPVEPTPVQEDELLEFSLDEISECGMEEGMEEEGMLEFDIPEEGEEEYIEIGDDPEAMLTALGDISRERKDWKENIPALDIPVVGGEEEELEEIKGQGKILRNTSHRLGLEPREGTPNLQESIKKQKALYESKIDELKKENKRLTESNKEMSGVIKGYQESFVDLRKQFDEMQTFNAKLAYANKIFASGGLSTADKAKIAEEFDKTQTIEEAKKLYNKILEENKISISKDNTSKIKASATNMVKSKDVVYESVEMKRQKILAGIEKNEDYI